MSISCQECQAVMTRSVRCPTDEAVHVHRCLLSPLWLGQNILLRPPLLRRGAMNQGPLERVQALVSQQHRGGETRYAACRSRHTSAGIPMGTMRRLLVSFPASMSVFIRPGRMLRPLLLLGPGRLPASMLTPRTPQPASVVVAVIGVVRRRVGLCREPSGWPLMMDLSSVDPIDWLALRRGWWTWLCPASIVKVPRATLLTILLGKGNEGDRGRNIALTGPECLVHCRSRSRSAFEMEPRPDAI